MRLICSNKWKLIRTLMKKVIMKMIKNIDKRDKRDKKKLWNIYNKNNIRIWNQFLEVVKIII